MALVKEGGFSSLSIFHRKLGLDDEAAGLQERAERLLYFYPRDIPLHAQLKHVGFCEGLIDFVRTFNGEFETQCLLLHKRRFIFVQVEPDIWLVLVLVNQQVTPPPSTAFIPSTDARAQAGTHSAVRAAVPQKASMLAMADALASETYSAANVDDAAIIAMLRKLYDMFATFYGSISRVVQHPEAIEYLRALMALRTKYRKLVDKRDALVSNYESLLVRAAEEATKGLLSSSPTLQRIRSRLDEGEGGEGLDEGSGTYTTGSSRAAELASLAGQVSAVSTASDAVYSELQAVQRFSPIAALRETLRNMFDFAAHYVDWSHITCFDGFEAVRYHIPNAKALHAVQAFVTHLEMKNPLLQHVALLYDGYLISNAKLPGLDVIYTYLRLHAFHVLRGTYVPDCRPLDFTSVFSVPVHARSRSTLTSPPSTPSRGDVTFSSTSGGGGGGSSGNIYGGGRGGGGSAPWSSALDVEQVRSRVDDFFRDAAGGVKRAIHATQSPDLLLRACIGGGRTEGGGTTSSSGSVAPFASPTSGGGSSSSASSLNPAHAFYRGAKPTFVAVPALPAAAATRRCLKSVVTVGPDWPVLNLPYIASDYLSSLRLVRERGDAEKETEKEGEGEGVSDLPPRTPPGSHLKRSAFSRAPSMVMSSSALGPPVPPRRPTAATTASSTTSAASASGVGGVRGPAIPSALPMAGDSSNLMFCPPVFATNTNASYPSHRLLWYQQGLITLLCYVDANGLTAAVKPTPEEASAPAPSMHSDVPSHPLQDLAAKVRELCVSTTYLPAIEFALSDSMDLAASANTASGMESVKHMHADVEEGRVSVHGYVVVSRRPGKGRDATGAPVSQAAPILSTAFDADAQRHLHLQLVQAYGELARQKPFLPSRLPFGPFEWGVAPTVETGLPHFTPSFHSRSTSTASPDCQMRHVALAASRPAAIAHVARKYWKGREGEHEVSSDPSAAPKHPHTEQHVLATRYDGAVAVRRYGHAETYLTLEGRTLSLESIDAKLLEVASRQLTC